MSDCAGGTTWSPSFQAIAADMVRWAKENKRPFSATVELTPYCNLRCPMCYVRLDPAEAARQGKILTGKQWLKILREAGDMGLWSLALTGGEPLVHPDFWDIYEGVTELGIFPMLYTNGCLIDEAAVERLRANPPMEIKVSLYGASNETYATMCGDPHGFDKVSRAIDLLVAAGLPVLCTCVVVKENRHELEAMRAFAAEKRIRFLATTAVTAGTTRTTLGRPAASRLSAVEVSTTLEALKQRMRPADEFRPFAYCGGYGYTFTVTWHGHLQFCAYAPKPYVQLDDETSFADAWDAFIRGTEAITLPEECRTCAWRAFCNRCPGLLAAASGDPSRVSPEFCRDAREMYELYMRLTADGAEESSARN